MTLGKLFRTTTFRLTVLYLAVFVALTLFMVAYISSRTTHILTTQIEETINEEIASLTNDYANGGLNELARSIGQQVLQPSASLYLLTNAYGATLAGNVADFPLSVLERTDREPWPVSYRTLTDAGQEVRTAIVRVIVLPSGFRLLVGRDVSEQAEFRAVVWDSVRLALLVMVGVGLLSWWFISRYVLKRVEAVAEISTRIMAGDLSERIQVTGSADEFDRLAQSLNAMLARIEQLVLGLKEVSDNIAHDLRTPLNRLRNRVEAALMDASQDSQRQALEATIEESDALIRTFDALLQIARVEAGASGVELTPVDGANVLADVADLYEPVAEEAGVHLELAAEPGLTLSGNRELLSQAVANLVDNAIKYAAPEATGAPAAQVRLSGHRADGRIELSVADTGPGIPDAERLRVTSRFVRLETSRSKPGSGLGLSLVAAVARLHGGEFGFSGEPGAFVARLSFPATERGLANDGKRAGS